MVFGRHKTLSSPVGLLTQSLKFFKTHARSLLLVGLVAEVVNIILAAIVVDNDVVKALWFALFVAPAFLLVIKTLEGRKKKLSIKQIYYDAGAYALPFLLTLLVLSMFTIPFSLGALIFSIAQVSFVVSSVEQIALFLVWIVFAIPSVVLITRYIFAQVEVVVASKASPAAALVKSGKITKGKFKPVILRLLWIALLSMIFMTLVVLASNPLSDNIAVVLMETALYLLVVPIGYIYLYLMRKELS